MEYLYHGSSVVGITTLKAVSRSRDYPNESVVYLTANRAYSLFYIWDAQHNNRNNKWVTCSLKGGIVRYYEQFPNQLYTFYNGVSGYLYSVIKDETFVNASESDMWLSKKDVHVEKTEFISNIYDEILKYEKLGAIEVVRFNALSIEGEKQCIDHIVGYIERENLLLSPDSEEGQFISGYFVEAWEKAKLTKLMSSIQ